MTKVKDKTNKNSTEIKLGLLSFLAIIIYVILPQFEIIPFQIVNININDIPIFVKILYMVLFEILIISSILLIFNKRLKDDLKILKKNHKQYFNTYIKYWFLILALMMFSNLIIMLINGGSIANNQELINEMFKKMPIYTLISSVIYAPICEELCFRLAVRNIIKNDILFIFISGLFFGSLHVITSYTGVMDLLYIIPYSIPGWVFAYIFVKSDNIYVPMGLHFMHNGILMSLQTFIFLFK